MDLSKALAISARDMDLQGTELRAVAEQLAQHEPPAAPAAAVESVTDSRLGVETLRLQPRAEPADAEASPSLFALPLPTAPAATDVRQDSRPANLLVMQLARTALTRAIDMLK